MQSAKQFAARFVMLWAVSLPLQADITITQLANEGAIISSGDARVMIDGMVVEPYSVYGGLPQTAVPDYQSASGAFAGIDLALSSHRHHDHHQPRFACSFLQGSAEVHFYSGSQVLGLTREKCRDFVTTSPRVHEVAPQRGQPEIIEGDGYRVTVFPLSHGTRKYARIQNNGHLIEIGGMKVLHIGDAAMDPTDFIHAGLAEVALDVALIPFWYFQPGPGSEVIDGYIKARHKIAVHIPPGEMAEVKEHLGSNYPDVLILENPLDEASFSPN